MTKEDIESTNDRDLNGSSNTGANFVDPAEYADNKSARTYVKDGRTIYEIALPFSNDDEFYEVSQDTYEEHIRLRKEIRDKDKATYQKLEEHRKKLKNIGYITNNTEMRADVEYEARILYLLESKQIESIKQIPGHVEEGNKEHQIQLFQTLAKKEKTPDFYEKSISDFLDKYEPTIENVFIDEDEITRIGQLFVIGHVDDVQLFYRFEQLKRENIKYFYKRIYLFGKREHGKKNIDTTKGETTYLSDDDMRYVLYFLQYKGGKISDLEASEAAFMHKAKTSYVNELQEHRLGRNLGFGSKYSGYKESRLRIVLGFTDDDFAHFTQQAQKEFIENFPEIVSKMNIYSGIESFPGLAKTHIDFGDVYIGRIKLNIDRITQRQQENQDFNKEHLIQKVVGGLKQCIAQGIQKIVNKEKPTKAIWENRKSLSYKKNISSIESIIDELYKELEKIDSNAAESTGWKANKETYIQEYREHHKNTFIQKRLIEVLKVDINDKEALEQQTLHDVEKHFLSSCKKRIESKLSDSLSYNPLSNRMVIKFIIASFFRTGHALVLKTAYPDNKERQALRQRYVQTITKNILSDTETRLADLSTFSPTEHYMREPLYYLYKKYGGEENILHNKKEIAANHSQYLEQKFIKRGNELVSKVETLLASEEEYNTKTVYQEAILFSILVVNYLHQFLADLKKVRHDSLSSGLHEENTIYNEEKNNEYPDGFIDDISLFGYVLKDVEEIVPQNIQTLCIDWYRKMDAMRPKILQPILQERFVKNGNAGGKLQRLSQEVIAHNFGVVTISKEQIDFLIQYFTEHLDKIILQDLDLLNNSVSLIWSDKKLMSTYIEKYMEAFKQSIALPANEQKYLSNE